MRSQIRERYRRWCVRRRRRKLLAAYATVGRRRHGLGPGFTPTMYALGQLEHEGLATITEDGLEWHWPEETVEEGESS